MGRIICEPVAAIVLKKVELLVCPSTTGGVGLFALGPLWYPEEAMVENWEVDSSVVLGTSAACLVSERDALLPAGGCTLSGPPVEPKRVMHAGRLGVCRKAPREEVPCCS